MNHEILIEAEVDGAEEYADLQAFYGAVVDMCNSRIVLRKQQ